MLVNFVKHPNESSFSAKTTLSLKSRFEQPEAYVCISLQSVQARSEWGPNNLSGFYSAFPAGWQLIYGHCSSFNVSSFVFCKRSPKGLRRFYYKTAADLNMYCILLYQNCSLGNGCIRYATVA